MADRQSFQDMKASRDNATDRVIRALSEDETFTKGSHYSGRIKDAVSGTEISARMQVCADGGTKCGSVFCASCRGRKQRGMLKAFNDHIRDRYDGDDQEIYDQLRWVTVLHSVVNVQYETGAAEQACLKEVQAAVDEMKLDLKNLARTAKDRSNKSNNQIWLRGGVHIELVDYDMYLLADVVGGKATAKEKTLRELIPQMDGYNERANGKLFLVHFHGLADIGSFDDETFRELFTDKWKFHRQVDVSRLWQKIGSKEHTLDDALLGMSRYCYNMSNARLDYSRNWGAGNKILESGETVDNKGNITAFAEEVMDRPVGTALTVGDLKILIKAHEIVSGAKHNGLSIRIH